MVGALLEGQENRFMHGELASGLWFMEHKIQQPGVPWPIWP